MASSSPANPAPVKPGRFFQPSLPLPQKGATNMPARKWRPFTTNYPDPSSDAVCISPKLKTTFLLTLVICMVQFILDKIASTRREQAAAFLFDLVFRCV